MPGYISTRYPDSTAVKTGRQIILDERSTLELALGKAAKEGENYICKNFVPGERLDLLCPDMTTEGKDGICEQRNVILTEMRSIPWGTELIGSCSGVMCLPYKDKVTFSLSFYFDLARTISSPIRSAMFKKLRNNYCIVFFHGDLAQHKILVQDGRITGLLDWEYAGDRGNMIPPRIYEDELACHQSVLRMQRP
ncbi:hypothetical protein P280DRAFT_489353 [Massarina eburnea CBS 473.64]|uniref:Uncharacterized protein n=1 Tax=Massarina eburnea CBS 473.64 TaxID=1395130 RepID=A0A6A6S411_9PLEO|nr:hypothetical protein P280DRAFT_489353 [Massarina eburnea CBS 473.64]